MACVDARSNLGAGYNESMNGSARDLRAKAIETVATHLRFPQAFGVFLALFVIDLILPDFIPFIDEILLGLGAVVFALWREKVQPPVGPKPPEKNVTPLQP